MQKIKFYSIWFCLIIIAVFLLQISISNFTNLFILNSRIFDGEIYRAITPIFLHGSLQHLIYNLFALALFGFLLERTIGSKRFLLVFFTTGILANLISVNFYNNSLGASGAIMGIIGTLTILRPKMFVWAFSIPMPMFLAATLWVIGDFIGVFIPNGVGNIAHLSGIAFGFLIGIFYKNKYSKNINKKNEIQIPEDIARDWEMTYLVKR